MSSNISVTQESKVTLSVQRLEEVIRIVVHEELKEFASRQPLIFELHTDSPLHDDMVNISERRKKGELKFHTHEEVWSG